MLYNIFRKKFELQELIQLYASTHTYHVLEKGNSYKTFNYLKNKNSKLNNDDIISLIALVTFNYTSNIDSNVNYREQLFTRKGYVKGYIDTVNAIEKNKSIFATKNNNQIGTDSNPILVAGIAGIQKYLDDSGCNAVIKDTTVALSLTDKTTDISYCIDEYIITVNETDIKLWFNIYGVENTNLYPKELRKNN